MSGIKEPQNSQSCAPAANQSTGIQIDQEKKEMPKKRGKVEDLTGRRFGMLTVESLSETSKQKGAVWLCKCDCGNVAEARADVLKRGDKKSCGCSTRSFTAEHITTHGLSQHPLYKVWQSMLDRCHRKANLRFNNYGGRGISVCEEWLKVEVFVEWAAYNGWKPGLQIDREDNNGNYCPENCRFVTASVNSHNRSLRKDNKTGYAGVVYKKKISKFQATITSAGYKTQSLGCYFTAKEAVIARDQYIIDNDLPHRLQVLTRD